MGRKSRKTKSLCQNTIEHEPDPEDTNEQMIKNTEHINDRSQNFIKTEDPTDLSYSQTGLYEVVMLDANDLIKEEFALEDPNAEEHNQEDEEEISYQLAGPPKMCSKCLEAFPIDNFSSHTCRDINADRFSCKICPRKFRYKSLLVVHLKSHVRRQKGESIPELDLAKPTASRTKPNFELSYSPTPRWKISRRRAGMLKRDEMRVHQQPLCLYCPIAFSNESHLEKHLKDHHAERLYTSELITPDFETDASERICVKLDEDETVLSV
ncbi:zinc finger protein 888 [Drosophila simulans]|uniref:C2H2-type domain-containing protein n=1 Tax=Drosophila simulans TaxID=7240 RepID=A0A0J9RVT1_DROSI|nr:zinc finger protein 888 [Drosophila simulans]XP_039150298.1 zinc finger protein 888 [Drosophila simulans]KMY99344.1 uncharacterized protein Dsimw501_GD14420 [Drosophila simulans]